MALEFTLTATEEMEESILGTRPWLTELDVERGSRAILDDYN